MFEFRDIIVRKSKFSGQSRIKLKKFKNKNLYAKEQKFRAQIRLKTRMKFKKLKV